MKRILISAIVFLLILIPLGLCADLNLFLDGTHGNYSLINGSTLNITSSVNQGGGNITTIARTDEENLKDEGSIISSNTYNNDRAFDGDTGTYAEVHNFGYIGRNFGKEYYITNVYVYVENYMSWFEIWNGTGWESTQISIGGAMNGNLTINDYAEKIRIIYSGSHNDGIVYSLEPYGYLRKEFSGVDITSLENSTTIDKLALWTVNSTWSHENYTDQTETWYLLSWSFDNCSYSDSERAFTFFLENELNESSVVGELDGTFTLELDEDAYPTSSGSQTYSISGASNYSFCIYPSGTEAIATATNLFFDADAYKERSYYLTDHPVNSSDTSDFNVYLLEDYHGIYVTINVFDNDGNYIQNALVEIKKLDGGVYETIDYDYTSSAGEVVFYLDPDSTYKAYVSKSGYESWSGTFNPSAYEFYALQIVLGSYSDYSLTTPWDTIQILFSPTGTSVGNEENITFTISDTDSGLTEYGIIVYNETDVIYRGNATDSGGGTIRNEFNFTPYPDGHDILVNGYFIKDGTTYEVNKTYSVLNDLDAGDFSISEVLDKVDTGVGSVAKGFMALFILLTVAVSLEKVGIKRMGGGIIVLVVLGLFVYEGWLNIYTFLLGILTVLGLYMIENR